MEEAQQVDGLKSSITGSVEGMTFGIQVEAFCQDFQRHGWNSERLPGKGSLRGKYLKIPGGGRDNREVVRFSQRGKAQAVSD